MKEKRDNWFIDYQDLPQFNIKGKRSLEDRLLYYDIEDFKDASVLDLGCNTGQMCFQSIEFGASRVMGVDYDKEAIVKAKELLKKINYNINFVVDDLDSSFFWNSIGQFDVVLFLSVIDTKEIKNRYGILAKVCMKTKNVMYFEGHQKREPSKYIHNIINYTDFVNIKYLGNTQKTRPFFRCSRKILSSDECVNSILQSKYNKIAVVGKGLAGKSIIREKLAEEYNNTFEIIDDLRYYKDGEFHSKVNKKQLKNFSKFILFDWKALEYYDEFEAVYFITPNENLIGQSRKPNKFIRSPFIPKGYNTLKEIYTVNSY